MTSSNRPDLAQIAERLRRADEHFESFKAKSDEFLHGHPQPYAIEFDRQNRGDDVVDVYRLQILRNPPLAISSIISDILHNLRSALDSLVFALGESHQGRALSSAERRESGFPIANLIENFDPKKIRSVSPAVVTEIERLQPYHRTDPETHRLAVLRTLSNVDKHRALHLSFFNVRSTGWYSERADLLRAAPGLVTDGKEIAIFQWHEPPKAEEDVGAAFTIQLVLDEKGTEYLRGATGFLGALIVYVHDRVVRPLSEFL